jgi:hypothetical protein
MAEVEEYESDFVGENSAACKECDSPCPENEDSYEDEDESDSPNKATTSVANTTSETELRQSYNVGDEKGVEDLSTTAAKPKAKSSAKANPAKAKQIGSDDVHSQSISKKKKKRKKEDNIDKQLEELNRRLAAVAAERRSLTAAKVTAPTPAKNKSKQKPTNDSDDRSVSSLQSSASTLTRHKGKAPLCHPKLDYVIADAALSPYLTNPAKMYTVSQLRLPDIIREIRFRSHGPEATTLPLNIGKSREVFMREVMAYKQEFSVPKKKKKEKRNKKGMRKTDSAGSSASAANKTSNKTSSNCNNSSGGSRGGSSSGVALNSDGGMALTSSLRDDESYSFDDQDSS